MTEIKYENYDIIPRVYIASPYAIGDKEENVRRQIAMATILLDCGCAPFAPLFFHNVAIFKPRSEEEFIQHDFIWLRQCTCLIRLHGRSVGADREVAFAEKHNIPVFYTIDEVLAFKKKLIENKKRKEEQNAKVRGLSPSQEKPSFSVWGGFRI